VAAGAAARRTGSLCLRYYEKGGRWRLPAKFPKRDAGSDMKKILKSIIHYLGYEVRALPRNSRYAVFEEPDARDYEQLN
jgi:hypothetical protein